MKSGFKLISLYLVATALVLSSIALAGTVSAPAGPLEPTGHTLEGIYNLIENNPASSHTLSPSSPITHSVSDIYVALANLINPASTTATYLGVNPVNPVKPTDVVSTFSSSTKEANGFTLLDIARLISNRTDNTFRVTTPSHSFTPVSGPIDSGPTLDSIYSSLTSLITASDIATGTIYLGVSGTYVPPPVFTKVVTLGVGASPDVSGNYVEDGDYGDYSTSMSYKQVGGSYHIWSDGNPPSGYKISATKGDSTNIFWSQGGQVDDTYSSQGSCVGSVTVHDYPYTPPTCTDFTYSSWSACSGGTQTRTIATQSPDGCTGGSPEVLSKSCSLEWSGYQGPMHWVDVPTALSAMGGGWRLPTVDELYDATVDSLTNGNPEGFMGDSQTWSGSVESNGDVWSVAHWASMGGYLEKFLFSYGESLNVENLYVRFVRP